MSSLSAIGLPDLRLLIFCCNSKCICPKLHRTLVPIVPNLVKLDVKFYEASVFYKYVTLAN